MKRIDFDINRADHLYYDLKLSQRASAEVLHVSQRTFIRRMRESDRRARGNYDIVRGESARIRGQVARLRRERRLPDEISRQLGLRRRLVSRLLGEVGLGQQRGRPAKLPPLAQLERKKETERLSDRQLAVIYGVAESSIAAARLYARRRQEREDAILNGQFKIPVRQSL